MAVFTDGAAAEDHQMVSCDSNVIANSTQALRRGLMIIDPFLLSQPPDAPCSHIWSHCTYSISAAGRVSVFQSCVIIRMIQYVPDLGWDKELCFDQSALNSY